MLNKERQGRCIGFSKRQRDSRYRHRHRHRHRHCSITSMFTIIIICWEKQKRSAAAAAFATIGTAVVALIVLMIATFLSVWRVSWCWFGVPTYADCFGVVSVGGAPYVDG